jgi:serine/threonine-protein kinase
MTTIKLPHGQFEYDKNQPLGKPGGFGQVFAGRSATNPQLAIKKLHLSAADAAHRELRIADDLAGRTLTYVVPIYDSGEDASSGDYFIVMARADKSLQDFIDKERIVSAADAAPILLQISSGLIEVGDLVHRDLKPQNVLSHEGRWKIADFGIARFVEESTSMQTLKEFLSPHYAAPEQWKQERATHATDVYALGCVGYCLVVSHPPFTTNPSDEHQHAPVPQFTCDDPRLLSLIEMMLRKLPEIRPSLDRIRQILEQIISAPMKPGSAVAELAQVGAKVAETQARHEAELKAVETAKLTRDALAKEAFQRLKRIQENLWKTISDAAPAARIKSQDAVSINYQLGDATLSLQIGGATTIESGAFRESKWDVITFSQIAVVQANPHLVWSASLWFARLPVAKDYRWYEVSYIDINRLGTLIPNAEMNLREADLAVASTVMHSKAIAFGPKAIDDENEAEFQERWLWLFARAASGRLKSLSTSPIRQWPPTLLGG